MIKEVHRRLRQTKITCIKMALNLSKIYQNVSKLHELESLEAVWKFIEYEL